MISVGLILAAGRSTRFGTENKLLAPFRGQKLARWAANAMAQVPVSHRLVVTTSDEVAALFIGYDVVPVANPDAGQAESLAAGVQRAIALRADRLLIALADMPLVSHEVMTEVLHTCRDDRASAASDGTRRMPPACFPAQDLPALAALTGDRGAGTLLRNLTDDALVRVASNTLTDVDTADDLVRLQR